MRRIKSIDNKILEFIRLKIKNRVLDKLMVFITGLGDYGIVWILASIIFFIVSDDYINGLLILSSLAVSGIVGSLILKRIFARKRPFDANGILELLILKPKDYSFPSGHTMSSFAAATMIFYINNRAGVISFVIAFLIAFSRLYLYVHYPTDVFIGAILGCLVSICIIQLITFNKANILLGCLVSNIKNR